MDDRKSSWEWLQARFAELVGPEEAARIWAEYHRRADLEEIEVKRRRWQRKLNEAVERFKAGEVHQVRTIERYQRWLDQLPQPVPLPAARQFGGPTT